MGVYLHVSVSPTFEAGTSTIEVIVNVFDIHGKVKTLEIVKGKFPAPNGDGTDLLELWVSETVRAVASAVDKTVIPAIAQGKATLILDHYEH
jgi:hypothetical protein